MTDIPSRSSSGVRGGGDDYQHLVTFNEALRAMRGNGVESITVEASHVGNVDDVVLRDVYGTGRFTQVKHAVDAQTPVGEVYLLTPNRAGGKSLLQRFHASWNLLRGVEGEPDLRLVTDRDIDPMDPVFRMLDRRSGLLVPGIADSRLSERRVAWAEHLARAEEELIALLGHLHIVTGRSMEAERETATLQLEALGLQSDQRALDSGMALVREWVQQRERTLSVAEVAELITERIGRRADPAALFVVEGVDDHAATAQADEHIRFVEIYEGASSFERHDLTDSADWENVVWPGLEAAGRRLKAAGKLDVHVAGTMRLPMWLATGCALRDVLGFRVATTQRLQIWSSQEVGARPDLSVEDVPVGNGPGTAVVLSIAADALKLALKHARDLGVARAVLIEPAGGASNTAVPDGPTAAAMAESIRNIIRDLDDEELHLFMAVPAGVALLLGHWWNRIRPTVVYEHTQGCYVRTYRINA